MAVRGNKFFEWLYNPNEDINVLINQFLDYLYQNDLSIFKDSPNVEDLNKEEHFFITCCSALIIWNNKIDRFDEIPKWCFDKRLRLEELYVFGRQYRDRGYNFILLRKNAPFEFTSKNVLFDPYSLLRV